METKNCTLCLKLKPASEYTCRKRECRECRNRKARAHYQENKEEILEDKRQWKQENKDKLAEKVLCECDCEVGKESIYKHKQSEKHKKLSKWSSEAKERSSVLL